MPIFATTVFSFPTDQLQQKRDKQLVPANGVARTTLRVLKPTVLRVAAEPAVASGAHLKLQVFSDPVASTSASGSGTELIPPALPSGGAIAEATDNNLFALLKPGSYLLAFEGAEPFLTTIGELRFKGLFRGPTCQGV